MAENSKIEWTKHTANLWWGCTEVHAGCDNCYARVLSHRLGNELWGNDAPRRAIKSVWKDLDKYQRLAAKAGEIHAVFVGSMMDIFEKPMEVMDSGGQNTDALRQRLFTEISLRLYPNLQFLFLTKRPSNINKYIPEAWKENPPPNVMFGTSPVNQETADKLVPQLLQVKGKKFLSVEPMLGLVDLKKWLSPCGYYCAHSEEDFNAWIEDQQERGVPPDDISMGAALFHQTYHHPDASKIDWVICGGESGQHKRPMDLQWARNMRDQCNTAGVPFFMKQIDKVQPIPEDLLIRQFPL